MVQTLIFACLQLADCQIDSSDPLLLALPSPFLNFLEQQQQLNKQLTKRKGFFFSDAAAAADVLYLVVVVVVVKIRFE